jgi:hypothetical protein
MILGARTSLRMMFSLAPRNRRAGLSAVLATGILAGCGPSGATDAASRHHAAPKTHTIATPSPTGAPADPAAVVVIRAWSDALRHGDVAGAARYFALPSVMINGPDANGDMVVDKIETRLQARAANAALPCGARFISADQRGRYVNALFRLTNRPGSVSGCGTGTGQTARTNFLIRGNRIVEWIRAPDDPGDNGSPGAPGPTPQAEPQASGPAA